ncbi:DUF7832 domain-containing protein [Oceanobacillus oncorhynchi]|uniref:DUF7832 domain-containing protein n=1 Tax=Oceanobacillus oncorhynchi TaxID=545501 RepID=UPI0034D67717
MYFDRIDYHHASAYEPYMQKFQKDEEELTESDMDVIEYYAGNHIGFFLTWIIQHQFEGELLKETANEDLQAVRNETMSGIEFFIKNCDGKFTEEGVSEEIFPFVNAYYERYYLTDYGLWVIDDLKEVPFGFIGTWENYHDFEYTIDHAYQDYKDQKPYLN